MRLLIAEDDLELSEILAAFLERNQYIVDVVHNGKDAVAYATDGSYDAIIMDIMMPVMDGIEALTLLRQGQNTTPVMLLTAKGEREDRIAGFDAGADDYLPKPFDTDELLSRLRAILRRRGNFVPLVLQAGDLRLDCSSGSLTCNQQTVQLSGREFQVMELLMRSPNMILSPERIMEQVWGWDTETEINVIWVHISNLRKKLNAVGSRVSIRTSRGFGYSLEVAHDP